MNENGVIHSDLKLHNMVMEHRNKKKVKIIDFGNAIYD